MNLKSFFITYPTEKEIALCLCKLCLNIRLLTEPLMCKAKADGDVVYDSATKFLMLSCPCEKEVNDYYSCKCMSQKHTECKNLTPVTLKCQNLKEKLKVYQLELTKTPHQKRDKKTGKLEENISKKTEKVEKQ